MQLPIGSEDDFRGVIDLVGMKALVWSAEAAKGEMYDTVDIPASHEESVREWRDRLLETIAENDDEMMELYLEGDEPPEEQLIAAIRRATIAGKLTPVLCGSAFKNKGVQPMLDAVVRYLPSPIDVGAVRGTPSATREKRRARAHGGRAAGHARVQDHERPAPRQAHLPARVLRHAAPPATQVLNSTKSHSERIGKIYRMHANKREEIDRATAGQIVAVMGLKNTTTGDTLCGPEAPVILESMSFPAPVISVAIEPKSKSDQEKLGTAIQRLAEEDPTFQVRTDEETGQTIIAGMGELHLDVLVDRMRREFRVEANVGKPQVAYRETIRRKVEKIDYTHKKQTGGSGQFAQGADRHRADRRRGRRRLRVREQGDRRSHPEGVHPVGRRRLPGGDGVRRARRLPAGRRQGHAAATVRTTSRLLRARVQDRRIDGVQGSRTQGRPGAARADDGGRGHHARGLHG